MLRYNDFQNEIRSTTYHQAQLVNSQPFADEFLSYYSEVIVQLQLAIQNAKNFQKKQKKLWKAESEAKEMGMEDGHIIALNNYFVVFEKILDIPKLNQRIDSLVLHISQFTDKFSCFGKGSDVGNICGFLLRQLHPLLHQFELLTQKMLLDNLGFHKSVCKLEFILLNVCTTLYKEGFCTIEEQEDPNATFQDNVEGTGLGEGHGKKDVSDTIENEEELDSLQNEKKEEAQEKDERQKGNEGFEMENDFEGELEDVDQEDANEEEESEEEKEIEKQMGEVDEENENVVDEKLWGEEPEDEELETKEEKLEKNAPLGNDNNTELEAKLGEDKDEEDKKKNDPQSKSEQKQDENEPTEGMEEFPEESDDTINEDREDKYEDNQRIDIDNTEEFKFDEQMDVDDEAEEEKETNEDFTPEEENGGEQEEQPEENVEDNQANESQEQEPQEEGGEVVPDSMEGETDEQVEDSLNPSEYLPKEEEEEEESKQQPFGIRDNIGVPSSIKDEDLDKGENETSSLEPQQLGKQSETSEREGKYQESSISSASTESEHQQHRMDPNPYRSYGDALKEWKKRLNIVDDEETTDQGVDVDERSVNEENVFKFMQEEDTRQEDTQTLGPATEINPEMELPSTMEDEMEEEVDPKKTREEKNDEEEMDLEHEKSQQLSKMNKMTPKTKEQDKDVDEQDKKKEKDEAKSEITRPQEIKQSSFSLGEQEILEQENIKRELSVEDMMKLRQELETQMIQWKESGIDLKQGEELWRKYESLTSDLSQELCEQLRLILAPTMASKLRGDFKTGKRLNMKKVIPYIASDFKKDKIWLRRTQPSKRQYQVMLAIDDSESMADNNAGQLACEALTMISKALSQLEVGELAILSFGEIVRLLHPFEQPFSDQIGCRVRATINITLCTHYQ